MTLIHLSPKNRSQWAKRSKYLWYQTLHDLQRPEHKERYRWLSSNVQRYHYRNETPIAQRKILSLVSLLFDRIGLLAPSSVHTRPLLKNIWTKSEPHWEKSRAGWSSMFLELQWKFPNVAETSLDRTYISSARDKPDFHGFSDAFEETVFALVYPSSQQKILNRLTFVIGRCSVAPMRQILIPHLEF